MLLLMAANAGRARSSRSAGPPTRNASIPLSACALLPVTGASRNPTPRACAAAASSRTHSMVSVLDSMAIASRRMAASAPSGPGHTLRDASSSASMAITRSAPLAASAGVAATAHPASQGSRSSPDCDSTP